LSAGGGVDCTIKTCDPRIVSSKQGSYSPSEKTGQDDLPNSTPKLTQIRLVRSMLFVHEKILRGAFLDISSEYLFYVVGIGGKGKKNLLMYLLFI
jgi:hypothetical protein